MEIKKVTKYTASDGKEFISEKDTIEYEQYLILQNELSKLFMFKYTSSYI